MSTPTVVSIVAASPGTQSPRAPRAAGAEG
jgi:hypothetical protein